MTPQEAYETIAEAYMERGAIVLVEGYPADVARQAAARERVRREVGYMNVASTEDRFAYLELVGVKRGRAEMRMLQIISQKDTHKRETVK
jgi:hypothetical protein